MEMFICIVLKGTVPLAVQPIEAEDCHAVAGEIVSLFQQHPTANRCEVWRDGKKVHGALRSETFSTLISGEDRGDVAR